MAHILKVADNNQKGVIVLTHKELNWLQQRIGKRDIIYIPSFVKKAYLRAKLVKLISRIKKRYFILIHWGGAAKDVTLPEWVDGNMTSPGTANFVNSKFTIPLASSHFSPKVMKNLGYKKIWDFLVIAKNKKTKNIEKFLLSSIEVLKKRPGVKVLLIIASNKDEPDKHFYNNIWLHYQEKFTSHQRDQITILKTDYKMGFQGLSSSALAEFYNLSKVFCLFSESEGHAKVVKEAQLCGLPVIVKEDVPGGVKDSLIKGVNAEFFSSFETAHDVMLSVLDNIKDYNTSDMAEKLAAELSEHNSLPLLTTYISELFEQNDEFFDGILSDISQLNRKLPAHFYDASLPWIDDEKMRYSTTDINTLVRFKKFVAVLGV